MHLELAPDQQVGRGVHRVHRPAAAEVRLVDPGDQVSAVQVGDAARAGLGFVTPDHTLARDGVVQLASVAAALPELAARRQVDHQALGLVAALAARHLQHRHVHHQLGRRVVDPALHIDHAVLDDGELVEVADPDRAVGMPATLGPVPEGVCAPCRQLRQDLDGGLPGARLGGLDRGGHFRGSVGDRGVEGRGTSDQAQGEGGDSHRGLRAVAGPYWPSRRVVTPPDRTIRNRGVAGGGRPAGSG